MSCRLPGAPNPDAFWQLLREGRDAIIETPPERRSLYPPAEPDESTQGLEYGGFLDRVDRFDAAFFGISPRRPRRWTRSSASCWNSAGRRWRTPASCPAGSRASATGVFVGAIWDDYADLLHARLPGRHAALGHRHQRSIIANRLSYALGLRGPSLTVDTGQSSSPRRRAPGLPRACARRVDARPRRRRQPQSGPRERPRAGAFGGAVTRTAAASPSTRGPTATCAARAAASSCSSPCDAPSPTATTSLRDPRQRRQQRRWRGWR